VSYADSDVYMSILSISYCTVTTCNKVDYRDAHGYPDNKLSVNMAAHSFHVLFV